METLLTNDPHARETPTGIRSNGWNELPTEIDLRGYGPWGEIVWLHGPERLGPRGGKRWIVRTRTRREQQSNRTKVWNGGSCNYRTRREALAAYRNQTMEVRS